MIATAALILLLLTAGGGGAYLCSAETPVRLGPLTVLGPNCRDGSYSVVVRSNGQVTILLYESRHAKTVWRVTGTLNSWASSNGAPVARHAHHLGPFTVLLH